MYPPHAVEQGPSGILNFCLRSLHVPLLPSLPTVRRGSRPLPLPRFPDGGAGTEGGAAEEGRARRLDEGGEGDGGGGEGGEAEADMVVAGGCAPPCEKVLYTAQGTQEGWKTAGRTQ